jgi:VWFA-related protein
MKSGWLSGLLLFLLSFGAAAAAGDMTAEIAQVNTSKYPEITLYVNVVGSDGRMVEGLAQEDFTVTEDSAAVEITAFSAGSRAAIATVLTIDRSGSMGTEGKLDGAKTAATTFVDLMREQDKAALVAFDNTVLTLQPFTSEKGALKSQIQALSTGDCTAWYDGVYQSIDLIAPLDGRRSVILLSDGIDCREDMVRHLLGNGSAHSLDEAIGHARSAGIPVYAIGVGAQATDKVTNEGFDEVKLRRVASETGGKYFHAPSAAELQELYRSLSVQMQKEYILTYRSPRPTYDGTRRDIVVAVKRGSGGGGATTHSGYLEKHLVNIRSDWRWFLALLAPLVLALAIPAVLVRGVSVRRNRPIADEAARNVAGSVAGRMEPIVSPVGAAASPRPGHMAAPLSCPKCGSALRAGARFCGSCGHTMDAPLSAQPAASPQAQPAPAPPATRQVSYCLNCGRPLRPGARFCGGCGLPF